MGFEIKGIQIQGVQDTGGLRYRGFEIPGVWDTWGSRQRELKMPGIWNTSGLGYQGLKTTGAQDARDSRYQGFQTTGAQDTEQGLGDTRGLRYRGFEIMGVQNNRYPGLAITVLHCVYAVDKIIPWFTFLQTSLIYSSFIWTQHKENKNQTGWKIFKPSKHFNHNINVVAVRCWKSSMWANLKWSCSYPSYFSDIICLHHVLSFQPVCTL